LSADEKPVFWDCADGEELHHTDPDDAIECHLNNWFPRVPETVTLTGYTHDVVPIDAVDHLLGEEGGPLRAVLDALQEPFGNPEEPIDATPAMLEAERAFVAAVLKEFQPWACHEVCSEEVDVVEWLREHDPERLADIEKAKTKL
jgi:hypothetical protein